MEEKNFKSIIVALENVLLAQPDDALAEVVSAVDEMIQYCSKGGLAERGAQEAIRMHWYTRLASAITSVAADPNTLITRTKLREICRRKQALAYIFNASGYRNMGHLISLMSSPQPDGKFQIKRDRGAVLLAFLALDDVTDELMGVALAQPPEVLFELMLGWLNQRAVLTEQGEKNRGTLLKSGPLVESVEITSADISHMVNVWMYSSYASTPDKHDIKKSFNKMFQSLLMRAGISPRETRAQRVDRPKVLVIHERFLSQHAMYRCYGPYVKALNERFETHALVEDMWIDSTAEALFKSVIKVADGKKAIPNLVRLVEDLAPQIIWYPSLGMSHWAVLLAGLRLAPLQIMTSGHPATSHYTTIDYFYITQYLGDPTRYHSEKVVLGNTTSVRFEAHSQLPTSLPPPATPSDRQVRIAVNSKVMKLSHRLIKVCERLNEHAKYPLHFVFLPGERHLYYDGLEAALRAQIPNCSVTPYVGYDAFLRELSRCDVALAAFPFGNANSTVDTCLLGIPTIAHFGPEAPAQSDRIIMETAGYPAWFVSSSDEEYYQSALRLINDSSLRSQFQEQYPRDEIRGKLLGSANEDLVDEKFGTVVHTLYEDLLTKEG